ncbi:aspartate--tRNA(Asn) ligase [Candidatus Daviesbacteria bacterium]|nr:aspartate--tRNA(Asn) ligase [Candidatus Daviesbacteria bacterium]
MNRTLILDCIEKTGEDVKICGFVQTKRDHGKITFIDIVDRSGQIQVVLGGGKGAGLHPQDVVCITGKVNKRPENLVNKNIPTGEIEIYSEEIKVLSKAAELPFDMGGKDLDLQLPTLLDYRSLTLRHPKIKDIFKVQSAILEGFRKACLKRDCIEIIVPTIAASSTEGGAEVFKVDYYGHKAFMTQSPQLYKQMLIPVFERVFTIAHAYRAEPSVTTRHLSETTQMDCEFGFVDFQDLLNLLEEIAVEMLTFVQEKYPHILEEFKVSKLATGKIPRLRLREAQEIIFKEFKRDNRKEKDLTPQDEVDICKWALEKHNSDFVTITHFPMMAKPFYTHPDPQDPQYSLSYDLLFRGTEILSGSQRINDFEMLAQSIQKRGMDPKDFEMYLQAFKYGMPPEGGFSYGMERLTKLLLGLENIREASLYPRDMERVDVRLSKKE